jgi:hypothetical protein
VSQMSKRIYWVSRHDPLPSQVTELRQLFGKDMELVVDHKSFSSAKEIVGRYIAANAQEMVLVAPLTVCRAILKLGVRPLWAEMREVRPAKSEVKGDGRREKISRVERHYQFVRFLRLVGIEVKLVEL